MQKMTVADGLPSDSDNPGWVMGWGVFRMNTWDLCGVFATEHEANQMRVQAGSEYKVAYGSHRLGSNDFLTF